MMIGVIERTSDDLDKETKELFQQCKPLLDKGTGFYSAIRQVKGLNKSSNFGNSSWYKRFRAYAESQGYKPLR